MGIKFRLVLENYTAKSIWPKAALVGFLGPKFCSIQDNSTEHSIPQECAESTQTHRKSWSLKSHYFERLHHPNAALSDGWLRLHRFYRVHYILYAPLFP